MGGHCDGMGVACITKRSCAKKSKPLAIITHPRGEIVHKAFCQRFTTSKSTAFVKCIINLDIYPSGNCTACAWATDSYKCRASLLSRLSPIQSSTGPSRLTRLPLLIPRRPEQLPEQLRRTLSRKTSRMFGCTRA